MFLTQREFSGLKRPRQVRVGHIGGCRFKHMQSLGFAVCALGMERTPCAGMRGACANLPVSGEHRHIEPDMSVLGADFVGDLIGSLRLVNRTDTAFSHRLK